MRHSKPWVLGLASSHNGAACLMHGDEIVAAVQEERILRRKRAGLPGGEPSCAVNYCLHSAGITANDLDAVVLCTTWPKALPREDISLNPQLRVVLNKIPVFIVPHHLGHAFAAFALSGFEDAAVLIVDGNGSRYEEMEEGEKSVVRSEDHAFHTQTNRSEPREIISLYSAHDTTISAIDKHISSVPTFSKTGMQYFGSLGDMYGYVGEQLFGSFFEGPGKVMGLAPYGRPTTKATDFFDLTDDRFYFKSVVPDRYMHDARYDDDTREDYQNLAASVQAALEDALVHVIQRARRLCGHRKLCYAGGVALNSVANDKLLRLNLFDDVYIMPAAEDSGTAIGAAYYGLWTLTGRNARAPLKQDSVGKRYDKKECAEAIDAMPWLVASGASYSPADIARRLSEQQIIGWFHGRSELGPRALGYRSIFCDPRQPDAKDKLNSRVKFREGFRPFAPLILKERVGEWFSVPAEYDDSPYMLRVWPFLPEQIERVPAVVHVDDTGRAQTLRREENPAVYDVVREFEMLTSVPIILNTSFNIAGEPIVESPRDALWCFSCSDIDCCVVEEIVVEKQAWFKSILQLTVSLAETELSYEGVVDTRAGASRQQQLPPRMDLYSSHWGLLPDQAVRRIFPQSRIRFRMMTPLGPVVHALDVSFSPLIERLDGESTGYEVLQSLENAGIHCTERELTMYLATLYRASIISLSVATSGMRILEHA
jgi:carbamoyltransferase